MSVTNRVGMPANGSSRLGDIHTLTDEDKEIMWQHGCMVLKPAEYMENPEDIGSVNAQRLTVVVIPINDFDPTA